MKQTRKVVKQTESVLTEMLDNGSKRISKREESIVTEFQDEQKSISKKQKFPTEPPYVKFYLENITFLLNLPKPYSSIIFALLPYAPHSDNENGWFGITKRVKEVVAKNTGHTVNYVEHVIGDLVKSTILYKDNSSPRSSTYRFNPYLIARGEWKDILAIRLQTYFYSDGSVSFKSELLENKGKRSDEGPMSTVEKLMAQAEKNSEKAFEKDLVRRRKSKNSSQEISEK